VVTMAKKGRKKGRRRYGRRKKGRKKYKTVHRATHIAAGGYCVYKTLAPEDGRDNWDHLKKVISGGGMGRATEFDTLAKGVGAQLNKNKWKMGGAIVLAFFGGKAARKLGLRPVRMYTGRKHVFVSH